MTKTHWTEQTRNGLLCPRVPAQPMSPSPWLNPDLTNDFRHEIELALEVSTQPRLIPDPVFKWICANNAEPLLYASLAKYAPLLPSLGYDNEVRISTAPPLSGNGNAIYLIMGKDKEGAVRITGGNYFSSPEAKDCEVASSAVFFSKMDLLSNAEDRMNLVDETMSSSISEADGEWLTRLREQCNSFDTMPIYLLVLDGEESYLVGGPALVEGLKQTNYRLECFGEVTL